MAKNALPLANKRVDSGKINANLIPNVEKMYTGITKLISLMNIHKDYIERATEISGPIYNKADVDEMKEQYNTLISDYATLSASFTPYVIT